MTVNNMTVNNETKSSRRRHRATACAIAALACVAVQPANAADAFNALKGSWSGGGSASFAGGQSEKLRCTARYGGGG